MKESEMLLRMLRRIAAIFTLVVVAAACLAVDAVIALSPRQLDMRAQRILAGQLRADFDFDTVSFSFSRGLRIEGLEIGNTRPRAFKAASVDMQFDFRKRQLTRIEIREPVISFHVNPDKSTSFDNLLNEGAAAAEVSLPEIEFVNGKIDIEVELTPGDIVRTELCDVHALVRRKPGSKTMALSVSLHNERLGDILVEGSLEPDLRNADVVLRTEDVDMTSIRGLLPREWKDFFDSIQPRGRLDFDGRFSLANGVPNLEATASVSNGEMAYTGFPIPLHDIAGTAEITLTGIKMPNFTLQAHGNPATMEGRIVFSNPRAWLRIFSRNVKASEELMSFVPDYMQKTIREYAPAGCADINVYIIAARDLPGPRVSVRVVGHGEVSIAHHEFPYRFENITGTLLITPERIELQDIRSVMDTQTMVCNGYVNLLPDDALETDITIKGRDVRLDERLRQALEEEDCETWDSLRPTGKCKVVVNITSAAQDPDYQVNVDALLGGFVAIKPELFPLEISGLTGTLTIAPDDSTHLRHIRGHTAGGDVVVTDTVVPPKEKGTAVVKAKFENVGVGRDVLGALSSRLEMDLEDLSAGGHLSGEIDLVRPKGADDFYTTGNVHLEDGWAIHKLFPVKTEGLEGTLFLKRDGYHIRNLTGNAARGRLEAWGELLELPGDRYAVRFRVETFDVLADDELRKVLPKEMTGMWDDYNPYGRMDVALWLDGTAPPLKRLKKTLKLHLRNISGKYVDFPCPFSGAVGDVRVDVGTGRVDIKDVYMPGRAASISGTVIRREDGKDGYIADLDIRLKKLVLDKPLRDAMPDRIQWMWKEIKLGGHASGLVKLHLDKVGDQDAGVDYDVVLRPNDAYFEAGFPFTKVKGKVTLRGNVSPEDKNTLKWGFLQLRNFKAGGLPITWMAAPIQLTDDSMTLDPITGKMANGMLSGTLDMIFGKDTIYSGRLELENASVKQAVSQLFDDEMEKTTGRANGWVDFNGRGWDKSTLRGEGEIELTEAKLWEVPFFSKLVKGVSFGTLQGVDFNESLAHFRIKGEKLNFSKVYFHSSLMDLDGAGTLFLDGKIDFIFRVSFVNKWIPIPILNQLFKIFEGEINAVRVTGTAKEVIITPGPKRILDAIKWLEREQKAAPKKKE